MTLLAASSCSPAKPQNPNELAVRAAKVYYDYLIAGNFEAYVDGFYRPDSIPGSYREQLIVNAKQYMAGMRTRHSGVSDIVVTRAETDTLGGYTNVFMLITFADSIREEIVVPMVKRGNEWKMK